MRLPSAAVLGAAVSAPLALCIATPRSRRRDVGLCCLNMWAYLAAYEMPHDDAVGQAGRVHVSYPARIDRVLGGGTHPTVRLQRLARPGRISRFERVLVWCHWVWFFVPHASVGWVLLRRPERFPAAAARMYGVFDTGAIFYWLVPTAPPWWAATRGYLDADEPVEVRRMMIEYGERFWGEHWSSLYDLLGGNPLAAMPSLHFATSLMGAHLLSEVGPLPGAVGWGYSMTLGLALVYLGEHYLIDLIGGAVLTESVRAAAPLLTPAVSALSRSLQALEVRARG